MTIDIEKIYGQWQAASGTLGGAAMAEEIVGATKLTIASNSYEVNLAGAIDSGSCNIEVDTDPMQMTIRGEQGPNSGKTILAIVELLGDGKLQIAYDLSGTDFPTSFDSTADPNNYVATFFRPGADNV